jgi:hypothetical protein
MKNTIIQLVSMTLLLGACAKTYTDKSVNVQGKTFAILPFDVTIEKNINVQKTTQAQLNDMAKSEAYRYQTSTYNYILSKQKDFIVRFQDIDQTNTLLKRNGITYERLSNMTKSELAQLLKVDGILSGKMYRKEIMPQAMAKGLDIITKGTSLGRGFGGLGSTKANDVNLSLNLYSAQDQRSIWTYQYDVSGDADQSPENIANALMNNAARKFPYRKK